MSTVLRGVTVVDPRSGTATGNRDVKLEGRRIAAVAESGTLAADEVVDASGQYVIPGFVDMHAHAYESAKPAGALALMLSYGITGFRQMSGNKRMLAGVSAPVDSPAMLARPGDLMTPLNSGSPERAIAAIREQHELGADFIKVGMMSAAVFYPAQAEAKRLGIPILGHLPNGVDVPLAVGEGMRSVEHLGPMAGLLACCTTTAVGAEEATAPDIKIPPLLVPVMKPVFARVLPKLVVNPVNVLKPAQVDALGRVIAAYDDDAAADLAQLLRDTGTWQVPTLVRGRAMQLCDDPEYPKDPDLRYVDRSALKLWGKAAAKFSRFSDGQHEIFQHFQSVLLRLTKQLVDAGVPMLTGSDACGAAWVVPGASLHREFDLLAEAGVDAPRILQMATSDAADFLGMTDSLGSVEDGKDADLVLLDANPLASVQNLHAIAGVVRGGRFYDSTAVTDLRERVAADRSAW
jgi:imidazolonepropionase-like amidohydrolase